MYLLVTGFYAFLSHLDYLYAAVAAYLCGCFNGALFTSRLFFHDDVRTHGSGNAGLTNFYRTYGAKYALGVILFDMGKTVIACLIGGAAFDYLAGDWMLGVLLGGLGCELGHMFPVFFGFKGGKGVLVAAGAILAIQPVLLPFLAIIFLVCLIPTGMVSLGSVTMAALYPVLTIIYGSLQGYTAGDMLVCAIGSGFMSGMVIYMHRANIQRIREGKEYRFGKHNKK